MYNTHEPFHPVLHIDTGGTWGGGQQQVLFLHSGLLKRGVPSILVCQSGAPLAQKAAAQFIPVIELKMRPSSGLLAAARIARLAREHSVSTFHMHTSHAHSLGLLAARLLRGDVHKVVSRRVAFPRKPNLFRRRKYLGRGIRYIAISQAVKKALLELGVPENDIAVVYSGIDIGRFSQVHEGNARRMAREVGIRDGSFVVGSVGSLVSCKGHAVLIESLAEVAKAVPNLVCLIVGEGPERPHLESLVARRGLQGKVILAGERDEIPELLSLMDLFVMPSLQEGLGLALLEAMAAGKPVIASNAGGMAEVVATAKTGFLVPPADPGTLADTLCRLIRDPSLMSTLGSNAKRHVSEHFSLDTMLEGTIAVYRSL